MAQLRNKEEDLNREKAKEERNKSQEQYLKSQAG